MRHTRAHTNNRRSHHALATTNILTDQESGKQRLPHRLDEATGMYRGKQVLPKKEMKRRAEHAAKKEKHVHEHDHDHTAGAREPIHSEKEVKKETGVMGRLMKGKAKARSGMGGGA
jgi:ribosomal protein L32